MGKLHELLSVEGDLSAAAERIIGEAIDTFSNKEDRFSGHHRTLTMLDDARQGENLEEEKPVDTTVYGKLNHVQNVVGKYYDALYQKETANSNAKADLIINGQVIANDVPATFLLGMESRLRKMRAVVESIPTLRPGLAWVDASEIGEHVFKAPAKTAFKTEKFTDSRILYEATEHHPAQIDTWSADKNVGRVEVVHRSGMISPAEKSKIIGRVDDVIRAVKKARQRANTIEVEERKIGNDLFTYIFG